MTKKQQTISGVSELPAWVSITTWEAFLVQRTKKKAANTEYALGLILGKLNAFRLLGHDANSILDASIEQGWVGVFLPRTPPGVAGGQQSFRERDNAQRQDRANRWTGRTDNVVEMPNATARLK
jgi:hypothetical protein